MKRFQINSQTIAYVFKDVILYTILVGVFMAFLGYGLQEQELRAYYFGAIFFIAVYAVTTPIPVFILLWNYWKKGDAKTLTIGDGNIVIKDHRVAFDQIKNVKVVGTYQHFSGHVGAATFAYNDYFYFLILTTNNGEVFILTSLLGYDLDKELKKQIGEEKFEQVIKWFPTI